MNLHRAFDGRNAAASPALSVTVKVMIKPKRISPSRLAGSR